MPCYIFQAFQSISKLLLEGVNPNAADNDSTALHYAVRNQWPSVCLRLLDDGANPTQVDAVNRMPIHIALQDAKNDEIAAMLLAYMPNSEYVCYNKTFVMI